MRVAVMGAGGVGGCLGGLLARSGHQVSLIARGAHLEAIRRDGLQVKGVAGEFTANVAASDTPSEIGPVDLVLFTVKTYHNHQAIPAIQPLVGDGTAILTLQNGVESAQQIGSHLGQGRVLPGAYWSPTHIEAPGVILVVSPPSLTLGESGGGQSTRVTDIQEAFQEAGVNAEITGDPAQMLWNKFVPFCAVAGITSASRTRISRLLRLNEGRELFTAATEEGRAVAKAKGVDLPADLAERMMDLFQSLPPEYQTSMHTDFENGRPTELDAINGAVVRLGREAGVPTPINFCIYTLLLPVKDGVSSG